MKTFLVTLSLFISAAAYSADFKVFEKVASPFYNEIESHFVINPELGRAWIKVTVGERLSGRRTEYRRENYRQQIEGLYYDNESKAILWDHQGQLIECAKVERGRIFRNLVIKSTGCKLDSRVGHIMIDDGYNQYRKRVFQVYLVTE